MKNNQIEQDIINIQEKLKRNPSDILLLVKLGNIYFKLNQLEDAISSYSRALNFEKNHCLANQNLGNICLIKNEYGRAEKYYLKVLITQPDNIKVINHTVFCQYKLENYNQANRLLENISENNKNAYSFRLSGLIALEEGLLDKASVFLTKSIKLDDKNCLTWSELGLVEKDRGNSKKAYECISIANKINPNHLDYYLFKSSYGVVIDNIDHREQLLFVMNGQLHNAAKMTALSLYILYCIKFNDIVKAKHILNYKHFIESNHYIIPSNEKNKIIEFILARQDLTFELKGTTTKNGSQTLSLASVDNEYIQQLIYEIKLFVKRYAKKINQTKSVYSSFIQKKVRLKIWSVVLNNGGYQAPHMHPGGIISGCYYLKFNRELNSCNAGNIEFGNPEKQFEIDAQNLTKMVQVEEGKLVIFPSYYFHNTYPTTSDDLRISIAFDVVPFEDAIQVEDNLTDIFELF